MPEKTQTQNQTQQQEGLKFSEEVIKKIAGIAASEVEGIDSMSSGFVEGFAERLGRTNLTKGVSVEVGEKQVAVDLSVIVEYGQNIPDVYKKVVQNVKSSIVKMTGLEVVEVTMHVEDVSTEDEKNYENEEDRARVE
ncbi:Asp23/Gls24 family envelope stress response protein [Pseudalkalibacillus decolorationis]|uniref:Asp23/Gls24 family envelope stress response protein n=1 Tax=Pseudalkalibacillus decolorationis TaxID=163879 RepID=UPI0021489908|nr:Asp23/Gls24 family envelope stress response protein [Pseudalkalibacillus decolorationis]